MRKSLLIVLACAFLVTQGVAYQFNTNTKYGKLQQECRKKLSSYVGRLSYKKDR